ncbi:MAG: N-ethylammeline chlorohydrolase [Gammaproteobacteria bacterium]|nr:MAG: N-ethylammeline chlorohydrolase [Gammaproteobacteria bacterium]
MPISQPEPCDLLLLPKWIVPVRPVAQVLSQHFIAVSAGRIVAIAPRSELHNYRAAETVELAEHVVLPGLINAHGHVAMSLLRGFADDLALQDWLAQHIWPVEFKHVNADFVQDGALLGIAEMILSGTTCFSDMYYFPEVTARACRDVGIRAQIATPIFDAPSAWGTGIDDYIKRGLALIDDNRHSDLISVVFGPHSVYAVSKASLQRVATLAAELDIGIQIHLHENQAELIQCQSAEQCRPIELLETLGLLSSKTQCVHMTTLNDADIARLKRTGASVIHCPLSNLKLASGLSPIARLHREGISIGLGSDGAASNNNLNLFLEMRQAALLAKLSSNDASALLAADILTMATLGGAQALGLDEHIGSLEVGKAADIIAVDLSAPSCQPVHNPLSQLVYACTGKEVSHSWVAGRCLLKDGQLQTLNLSSTLVAANTWRARLSPHSE